MKAHCPKCGRLVSVKNDGRFYAHRVPKFSPVWSKTCLGSNVKVADAKYIALDYDTERSLIVKRSQS